MQYSAGVIGGDVPEFLPLTGESGVLSAHAMLLGLTYMTSRMRILAP
jgi:hypothetical protein